ncbi:hypothetical protein FSARC_11972 [Fusarium sarcochroum]|uniref:Nephrocystin 3-like N-terminal domain-containing protein n=1 Tax=Fusarium sarcochroum TaxID=1208366 RepID=A0A8H4TBR6_9HYPO|nr:hypothetical protein FSARC_11972 [Fusarium sarcochroum]
MPDSDSDTESSSSGSVPSRRASLQPQNEPENDTADHAPSKDIEEAGNNLVVDDAASDSNSSAPSVTAPDGDFLHLEWENIEKPQGDDGDIDTFADEEPRLIDFVAVPGIYGNWSGEIGESPGSGSSAWVYKFAGKPIDATSPNSSRNPKDSCRVFWYEYESAELFCGRRSRQVVHQMALKLLTALRWKRRNETKKRLIYFISHDIGGLIVKDALVTAALERDEWKDISEMTRVLIFNDYPHRYHYAGDLENRLTNFIFQTFDPKQGKVRPTASSIAGISETIVQVNGLFIDSKVPLRSWITNIHTHDAEGSWKFESFGPYCSTLGLPLEKRLSVPSNSDYSVLTAHLGKLEWDIISPIEPKQYRQERRLLALASPVYPLRNDKMYNFVSELPEYQAWLDNPSPQILYLHGSHRAREAAEQVFYALESESESVKRRAMVLYFSFDRWDVRCDSIRDMIATFLTQIANHYPKLGSNMDRLFAQLDNERGWTETDLIQFFERFRTSDEVEQTMIVINHFDECTKGSRKRFLDNIIYKNQNDESPWKIVVTSHKPGALSEELSGPFCVPVDLSKSDLGFYIKGGNGDGFNMLSKLRPDLVPQEEKVLEELKLVETLDPPVRQIIYEQARMRDEWPDESSTQEIFAHLDFTKSIDDDEEILVEILDWVLKRFPDQAMLRPLLSWLLYAVRPLTIWELATVLSFGTDQDRGNVSPTPSSVQRLISKIQKGLAGIIEVEHNEVRFQHPRLHNTMVASGDSKSTSAEKKYWWDEIRDTAHADITNLCLEYLSRPSVQEYIEKSFQVKEAEPFETPTFPDRANLASYAIQAWTHHYSLSSLHPDLSVLISHPELVETLARSNWALANPITKSAECPRTLFSIFAGLGMPNAVKPQDDSDDLQGLLEAARKEKKQVIKELLDKRDFTQANLWKALEATSSSGNEDMMLSLLERITSKHKIPTDFDWPPILIYRAGYLGLDRFAERILTLGCTPDPDVEWKVTMLASPLFQAARHGHASTVRVLLKHGASMEFTGLWERNSLHVAAVQGYTEVIRTILEERKVEIDRPSDRNFTAMYLAVVFGHPNAATLLLDKGADPNMGISSTDTGDTQWTPLVVVADDGFEECAKLLLDRGANPNICGPVGPPLRWAVSNGRLKICNMLLDAGADPRSELLKTPLLVEAAGWGFARSGLSMLERLLELDLDVNAKDDEGNTALLAAAQSYPREFIKGVLTYKSSPQKDLAVRKLLDRGADPNLANDIGMTPLLYATSHQQLSLALMLLEAGADVNQGSKEGISPLFDGIGVPGMARLLLEKGANPDVGTSAGWTPLTGAAYFGYDHAVEPLLDHGASIDLVYGTGVEEVESDDLQGWSPLMCAASNGYHDIFRTLAEAGANLQHRAVKFEQPVLHVAAFCQTLSTALEFPSRIDVNQVDNEGWSAIHFSSMSFDDLKRIVNAGANIELENNNGDTALTVAAPYDLEKTKYLIKKGANINHVSAWFGSALHQACRAPKLDIIEYLIEKGADINSVCQNVSGTPLQSLCLKRETLEPLKHEELVRYLFFGHDKQKPDVTLKAGWLGYAINAAALGGTPGIINLILDQEGATIDVKDDMGRMPIHLAAASGWPNFEVVLDRGGDIYAKDNTGRTALHWAARVGHRQVVEKIISLTEDKSAVDAPDIDGWTPLCWAARGTGSWLDPAHATEPSSDTETIKVLLENGADRNVMASLGDEKWTPLRIARFSRSTSDIVSLITHGLPSETASGEDANEESVDTKGEEETKPKEEQQKEEPKFKLGIFQTDRCCDGCQCNIYGFVYICKTCPWFYLCFKCYPHAALLHSPEHEYKQEGGEEDEEDEKVTSAAASSNSSDTDSDSSSGSEASDNEDEGK